MHILTENFGTESKILTEAVNDAMKSMYLNGCFMQADIRNRNNRVYPLSEMTSAVADFNNRIKENNGIAGEADHPSDRLSVAIDRVSHIITELHMDGSNAHGRIKILNTPCGQIVKEIINAGYKPAVSSRGAGNVDEEGVVSGFVLQTIDVVLDPSASGARPSAIFESLENTKQGKKVMTLSEALVNDPSAQKFFKKEFDKFLIDILKK
jgi:hypothetical protein